MFLLDTGSLYTWVESILCVTCPSNKKGLFNEKTSTTHRFYDVVVDLHYGSGSVYGYNSIDHVCISKDTCATNYSFLTIAYETNLGGNIGGGQSGFIGLGYYNPNNLLDLFITKYKKEGIIKQSVFSIYVDDDKRNKLVD